MIGDTFLDPAEAMCCCQVLTDGDGHETKLDMTCRVCKYRWLFRSEWCKRYWRRVAVMPKGVDRWLYFDPADEPKPEAGIVAKHTSMERGQKAYEAYCAHTNWKSLVSGQALPPWRLLKPEIQLAWEAAAKAIP